MRNREIRIWWHALKWPILATVVVLAIWGTAVYVSGALR